MDNSKLYNFNVVSYGELEPERLHYLAEDEVILDVNFRQTDNAPPPTPPAKPEDTPPADPAKPTDPPADPADPAKPTNPTDTKVDDEVDAVEIGDVTYILDENGNALDEQGQVKYTKEQLEAEDFNPDSEVSNDGDDSDDDNFSISKVEEITKIKVLKDGQELKFEDTVEGIAKRELAIAEQYQNLGKQAAIDEYFKSNPELDRARQFLSVNGSLKDFGKVTTYKDVEIDPKNTEQMASIIIEGLKLSNMPESQISSYVEYLRTSNGLEDAAKTNLDALKANEAEITKNISKKYQEQLDADRIERENFTKNVKNIISSGKVNDFSIGETFIAERNGNKVTVTRNELIDYITKPRYKDSNGTIYSEFDKDAMFRDKALKDEDIIIDALTLFTGSRDLVNSMVAAKTKKNIIRKRIKIESNKPRIANIVGKVKDSDIIIK
jgi:hypothetical protein